MIGRGFALSTKLAEIYKSAGGDPDFHRVLNQLGTGDDAELADLIEADGRLRLRLNRPIDLERYLMASPDLSARPDPLDAAIDMALRALARSGRADEQAIEALISSHPQLEVPIREAAALGNALWSTTRVRGHVARFSVKELPCDFGPVIEKGERRYELRDLLGEGAFGQVYLAVDRQLSEEDHPALVAVKVLTSDGRSHWTRQQLIDEATKARRTDHPNVARVLDRGVSDQNEDFIVYEYVDGGDLGKVMRRRHAPLTPASAARLVASIARGVHAAHMAGLVHCDIKPSNIVLTSDGEPKVADFGIAIRTDEQDRTRQAGAGEGVPAGNLAFMSPEQYRMEPGALTIPSDVYALGGLLYWLATGQLPNGDTPEEIEQAHGPGHGRHQPPSIRTHCSAIDHDLDMICQRALALRPEDRHSSAAALADDLEAWVRHEAIAWTRPSIVRRAALWARRKPALAVTSALLIMLFIASAVVLVRLVEQARARAEFNAARTRILMTTQAAADAGLEHQVLGTVWLFEWFYGPTALGLGDRKFELFNQRIAVLTNVVEDNRRDGTDHTIAALIWETALGFWLIDAGRHAEAEPGLQENLAKWREILHADDPFLSHVEGMLACIEVHRLAEAAAAGHPSPEGLRSSEELAALLDRLETEGYDDQPRAAIHHLMGSHLVILYGPDLLDDPAYVAYYEFRITDPDDLPPDAVAPPRPE